PIDTSGVFPDGTKFNGMAGLKKALLAHPEQFVNTVAEKLLMYAISRNVQYYDAPAVRAIVRDSAKSNYTFGSLVLGVVRTPQFQMRKAPAAPSEIKPPVPTAAGPRQTKSPVQTAAGFRQTKSPVQTAAGFRQAAIGNMR